ncbi:MAG: long-chain fatty acid--CoA ligase, partial [Nanoarchaeota archaeon]|nr:long-chain fatty acid--CoA ligase [Nanoarchaeota archaeon]
WKNEAATREAIKEGWLYTGDMGYMTEDGFLYVLGRFKSLLIADDGEKFSPEGIEEAISQQSKYIDQCMLYNNQKPYTVALIVPNQHALKLYLEERNLTKAVEKIPVLKQQVNYHLYTQDNEESRIDWDDYEIRFMEGILPVGDRGALILKFSEKWAVMVTRNNSYFLRPDENGIVIDEIRNPLKSNRTQEEVVFNISMGKITMFIDNTTVFVRDLPNDYRNGTFDVYMKNTFLYLSTISIKKHDAGCADPRVLMFCDLQLETQRTRQQVATEQQDGFRIDEIMHESSETSLGLGSFSRELMPGNMTNTSGNATRNITIYSSDFRVKITNPFIPDRRLVFNTPSTSIVNKTNGSIDYSYQALDGARVMEIGFEGIDGQELLIMHVLERSNKLVISGFREGTFSTVEINMLTNMTLPHSLGLSINGSKSSFYFDGRYIYSITGVNTSDGHFFVGSRNTYTDLGTINLRTDTVYKRFQTKDDPCELRVVYHERHPSDIIMQPGEELIFHNTFSVSQDFDFGKIFVDLSGTSNVSANDSIGVHFWVMRDD